MEAADLFLAYVRRSQFEARILARELAEIMMGATAATGAAQPTASNGRRPPNRHERIPADQMLRECGVTL
ncbi:MAG: hypothetical protein IPM39_15140 [Chloroflexi bacterium]|nr:hypothetical protein [Chloroflexota bacterium]